MSQLLLITIISILIGAASPRLAYADRLEELSKSLVFLLATPSAEKSDIGTGFLIAQDEVPVLATAEHVARKLNRDSLAVIRGADGDGLAIALHKLTGASAGASWHYHPTADLAVVCLNPVPEVKPSLQRRFLPVDILRNEASAPSRAITLTVFGFPLALGISGKFSPISRETKPASGLLLTARGDTKARATFFVTQDPSVGGFSGAPVLDTGLPYSSDQAAIVVDQRPLQIVGIVHGTISDDSGGKLGTITPAHLLRELVGDKCKR